MIYTMKSFKVIKYKSFDWNSKWKKNSCQKAQRFVIHLFTDTISSSDFLTLALDAVPHEQPWNKRNVRCTSRGTFKSIFILKEWRRKPRRASGIRVGSEPWIS